MSSSQLNNSTGQSLVISMPSKHIALIATLLVSNAWAAGEDLQQINVGELGAIQAQTIKYKAEATLYNAKADLETARSATTAAPSPQDPQPSTAPLQALPVVSSITGSAGRLRATLRYSNGSEVEVSQGRTVPGGYKVAELSMDGVTLSQGQKRYPLGFSSRTPAQVSMPLPGATAIQPLGGR